MEPPQVVCELKRDALGRVELLDGAQGRLVRRVACGGRVPLSGLLARMLLRRERRALERLVGEGDVAAVGEADDYARLPSLDGSVPRARDVLLRTWISGRPLSEAERLPEDFFELLAELLGRLHARGVCHNDLHKEPNVLVQDDGRPALVDFQLASLHARLSGRTYSVRVRDDLRHVQKHRARYLLATGRARAGEVRVPRRSFFSAIWRRVGKPLYNFVTRCLLRTRDGERGRPEVGPWPRWTPPLGHNYSDLE